MKFKHLMAIMAFVSASLIASASYAGVMTGITAPASAAVGTPVSVTITGAGICSGGYTIHWGDSNSNTVGGEIILPHSPPSHTYTSTGTKTMSVTPSAVTCSAPPTTTINITGGGSATVTGISGPSTDIVATPYAVTVTGAGTCALVTVNWGDSSPNSTRTSYNLAAPTGIGHTYTSTGTKTITATGSGSGCSGSATKTVTVNSGGGGVVIPPWARRFKIWVKPPWPRCPGCPPCLSCPGWLGNIRGHETQMKKYSKLAQKPGKRQAYYMRKFKMHKGARASLIRKYSGKHRSAMKFKGGMKKGAVPRRGMQRKMAPGVRHQMK